MEENKGKKKIGKSSLLIVLGILVVIVAGVAIASIMVKGNGSGAKYASTSKANVQVNFNYNLFVTDKTKVNIMTAHNEKLNIITLNGKWEGSSISLGRLLNMNFTPGEKYKLSISYVGGSYTSTNGNNQVLALELQQNSKNYSNRTINKHYVNIKLPKASSKMIEKELTITGDTANANGIYYWMWQKIAGGTTFNNYRIRISATKVDSKKVSTGGVYGNLPTPVKDGYKFLGWYDKLSDSTKIVSTTVVSKKTSHTLYAHWKATSSSESGSGSGTTPTTCNIKNCEQCKSTNTCSTCKSGYTLTDNSCIKKCGADYTYDSTTDRCLKCPSGYRLEDGKCKKTCKDGYGLLDGKCHKCNVSGCATCNGNMNRCDSCPRYSGLNDGKCTKCADSNCSDCYENYQTCTLCMDGFKKNSSGKCVNANDKTCKDGYGLIDGKCYKCKVSGCARCNGNLNRCDSCPRYSGLNDGKCTKCADSNCSDCYENYQTCTLCMDGFKKNSSGKCIPICGTGYTYDSTTDQCLKCPSGYRLEGGKCKSICRTGYTYDSTTDQCFLDCPSGYKIYNGKCIPICNIDNCTSCSSQNVCSTCKSGYTLTNNSCIKKCGAGYTYDSTTNRCLKCPSGYRLEGGKCIPNCNINNCDKCKSTNTCSTCKSGYTLYNGECVSSTEKRSCWCLSSTATTISGCVTNNGKKTLRDCANTCNGGTPKWQDETPACPYNFYNGTCVCISGYNATCIKDIYSDNPCSNCSGSCESHTNEYGQNYAHCTKRANGLSSSTTCAALYGSGWYGSVLEQTASFACTTYSSCRSVCSAKNMTYKSGTCERAR